VMSLKKENPAQEKPAWGGASPWGPPAAPATPSFKAIQNQDLHGAISEQQERKSIRLVQKLMEDQVLEDSLLDASAAGEGSSVDVLQDSATGEASSSAVDGEDTTANDLAIARALQYNYDMEHDLQLEREKRHRNKDSKLTISNDHMRILPSLGLSDAPPSSAPVDILVEDDDFEPALPACGYLEVDGKLVTKHDQDRTSRHHTRKMMKSLPCDVNMGDTAAFPIRMEGNVFNSLKSVGAKETKRKARKHDQAEKSTLNSALDASSSVVLVAMLNSGVLDEFGGVVSTGKEAVVFGATIGEVEGVEESTPCAVKVFKTRILEFKTREKYIRDDHRFTGRLSKTNAMTNLMLWAEKEFRNLHRIHRVGLPCPEPFYMRKNVIAMSFIGHNNTEPAPQLKNVELSSHQWQKVYEQTLDIVRGMLHKCHLVHADLSEYNLLYYENQVHVIDFAQSVDITHGNAFSYLYRDLCTIVNFFKRKGVKGVQTGIELLEEITGISLSDCGDLSNEGKVETTEEMLSAWRDSEVYSDPTFEFLWTQSQVRGQMLASVRRRHPLAAAEAEAWLTRRTDASVAGGRLHRKRRRRRPSGPKAEGKPKEEGGSPQEDEGFCLVEAEGLEGVRGSQEGLKVRFDVSDTADTTDYNADQDTDAGSSYSPRCSGDDTDPPAATDSVTDTGGETEGGYAADGDDTEGDCFFAPRPGAPPKRRNKSGGKPGPKGSPV